MDKLIEFLKIPKGSAISVYRLYGDGDMYNEIVEAVEKGMSVITQPTPEPVRFHIAIGSFKAFTPDMAEVFEKAVKPKETIYLIGWKGDTAEDMAVVEMHLAKKGFLTEFRGYAGMIWDADIRNLIPVMVGGRYRKEKEVV